MYVFLCINFTLSNISKGKLAENVMRYGKTKLVSSDNIMKIVANPFYKDHHALYVEDKCLNRCEISMSKKVVRDQQPVPVAYAILNNSKVFVFTIG